MQEFISLSQSSAVEKYKPAYLCRKREEILLLRNQLRNGKYCRVKLKTSSVVVVAAVVSGLYSVIFTKMFRDSVRKFYMRFKTFKSQPICGILNFNYDFSTDSYDRKREWVFCGIKLCFFLPFRMLMQKLSRLNFLLVWISH